MAKNSAKSQTRLTSERRAELVTDYEAGMPVHAIAVKFGVHRGTIAIMARRSGTAARVVGLGSEERKRASSLYGSGMTLMQVAQHMGIGDEAVRQAVIGEGGTIRPRGRRLRSSEDLPMPDPLS